MSGLYDTGAPKRVIVEHRNREERSSAPVRMLQCPNCGGGTDRIPCAWCGFVGQGRPKTEVVKEKALPEVVKEKALPKPADDIIDAEFEDLEPST